MGRTYCIDNRYLLKIYDTDTAVGKLGLQRLSRLGAGAGTAAGERPAGTESAVPSGRRKTAFSMFMTGLPERFFSFIPGEAVGYGRPYTGEELRQLSRIVKELHLYVYLLFADICPAEAYELPFCDALERLLLSKPAGCRKHSERRPKGRGKCSLAG